MRANSPLAFRDARVLHRIIILARFAGLLLSCAGFWLACPVSSSWYEKFGIALVGGLVGSKTLGTLGAGAGYFFVSLPIGMQIKARNLLVAGTGRTMGFLVGAIVGRLIGGPIVMAIGCVVMRWVSGPLA